MLQRLGASPCNLPRQHLRPHPPSDPDTRRGEEGETKPDCFYFTA